MDQASEPGEHSATGSRSARWRPDKARQREVALLASVESTRWNWLEGLPAASRRRSPCSASLRGLKRQIWVVITPFAVFNKVYIDGFETMHGTAGLDMINLCISSRRCGSR